MYSFENASELRRIHGDYYLPLRIPMIPGQNIRPEYLYGPGLVFRYADRLARSRNMCICYWFHADLNSEVETRARYWGRINELVLMGWDGFY